MKKDGLDKLNPNDKLFESMAWRALDELGEIPPNQLPQGKTWRGILEDAQAEIARRWFEANFCPRCRLNPIEPELGETICIPCTYTEKGEQMFTPEVIKADGLNLRKDHFGRVHVLPDTLPDRFDWPVLKTVERAIAIFGETNEEREYGET